MRVANYKICRNTRAQLLGLSLAIAPIALHHSFSAPFATKGVERCVSACPVGVAISYDSAGAATSSMGSAPGAAEKIPISTSLSSLRLAKHRTNSRPSCSCNPPVQPLPAPLLEQTPPSCQTRRWIPCRPPARTWPTCPNAQH